MKNLIKIEELAMFGLGIYLFSLTNFAWWWFLVLILTPDIGMLGYFAGSRVGAVSYNLLHHKGIALLVLITGWIHEDNWVELAGIILFAHSSLDRMMGYGLKYPDSFQNTHLGTVGKQA